MQEPCVPAELGADLSRVWPVPPARSLVAYTLVVLSRVCDSVALSARNILVAQVGGWRTTPAAGLITTVTLK